MSWSNPLLQKSREAESATVNEFRFVKFGTTDERVQQAAAATDKIIGIARYTALVGKDTEITLIGIEEIKLGGTVALGDELTSDASGKGIVASPGSGVNNRIGGIALKPGVDGDIIPCLLKQGTKQG